MINFINIIFLKIEFNIFGLMYDHIIFKNMQKKLCMSKNKIKKITFKSSFSHNVCDIKDLHTIRF